MEGIREVEGYKVFWGYVGEIVWGNSGISYADLEKYWVRLLEQGVEESNKYVGTQEAWESLGCKIKGTGLQGMYTVYEVEGFKGKKATPGVLTMEERRELITRLEQSSRWVVKYEKKLRVRGYLDYESATIWVNKKLTVKATLATLLYLVLQVENTRLLLESESSYIYRLSNYSMAYGILRHIDTGTLKELRDPRIPVEYKKVEVVDKYIEPRLAQLGDRELRDLVKLNYECMQSFVRRLI